MFVQKSFITIVIYRRCSMKKIKKQKHLLEKYIHKIKKINLDVSDSKCFLPFDMEFIWEYPTNNIFRAVIEKTESKSAQRKDKKT